MNEETVNFIQDFEVVRQIGSGSFSNVYLCKRDASFVMMDEIDDLFIIKEINTHKLVKRYMVKYKGDYRFKRREVIGEEITPYEKGVLINTEQEYYYKKLHDLTLSEIEILSSFNDDNIVKFYTWNKTGGIYYLRMEYCDGGDVYEYIKKNGRDFQFSKEKYDFLWEFCNQVARGLEYIHDKNIIHRDIKLQNVLIKTLSDKLYFKISDFGFACYDLADCICYDTESLACKKYYKLCGTPYYMAPEIVVNMNREKKYAYCYNKVADIWSFGICIYELIFGGFPFTDLQNIDDLCTFYEMDSAQEDINNKIEDRVMIHDDFKKLMLHLLVIPSEARYRIHNVINSLSQIKSIYVKTDLEKEMSDIINSQEHAYLTIKHKFLTESDIEMSWQYV